MKRAHGMTLVEVLVVLAVVVAAACVLLVLVRRARIASRQVHDGARVGDVHRGFVLGGQGGPDSYLLPSWYDKNNTTIIAEDPFSKNTTANILSIHIYNGFFGPEGLISPSENNPRIRTFLGYQQSAPTAAAVPMQALWDPSFSADFVNGVGGTSYVHVVPGNRSGKAPEFHGLYGSARWSNSFQSSEAFVATRGPQMSVQRAREKGAVLDRFDKSSNTLRLFGRSSTWRGNVAYNDNHVQFESSLAPSATHCSPGFNQPLWDDFLFADEYEPRDGDGGCYYLNSYLGIFTKAGPTIADYGAIWD